MSSSSNPTLKLHLSPNVDDSGTVNSLSAKLTIGGLRGGLQGGSAYNSQEPIFLFVNDTDSNSRDVIAKRGIRVEDDNGPVNTSVKSRDGSLAVFADRDIHGNVSIQFDTCPQDACDGNHSGIRRENGGLVGIGTFLPRPYTKGTYDITITTDTTSTAKIVTSLGEGATGTETTLQECIFMIGNIHSCPTETTSGSGLGATYWLSDLPRPLDAIKDFSNMFPHLSKFFKDEYGTYRAFLAKTPKVPGRLAGQTTTSVVNVVHNQPFNPAGPKAMAKAYNKFNVPLPSALASTISQIGNDTSSLGASLVEYDEDTASDSDWSLVRVCNKSMIKTWAQLDPEDDGTPNDWFSEGLSNLYTIYLPFRFKQRSPDYFRATLNANLTAYFTTPLINTPLSELPPASTAWHVESLRQSRFCMYMIRMDCFTRRASVARNAGVERPIDEIVADISVRRRKGEKVQEKDWLKYIGDWIGHEEAKRHLDEMKSGKVLDLEDMKTAFGGIDAVEGKMMQVGFDRVSLTNGVVSGIIDGSNASMAGLKNGDEILWHSRVGECEADCGNKFTLRIRRHGEEREIEYLPREDKVVKMWRSIKKET